MQSKGAKEKVVTRIVVSRCEVDLKKIRSEFKRQHKKSLFQTIAVSTRAPHGPFTARSESGMKRFFWASSYKRAAFILFLFEERTAKK